MKYWLAPSMILASGIAHAETLLKCTDSDGAAYNFTRDARAGEATLEMRDGDRVVASQSGRLQAAGLTGTVRMLNREPKANRCEL